MDTLEMRHEGAIHAETSLAPRRRLSLFTKGALAAAVLGGIALFVRELPDLRRYLRLRRM